MHQFLLDKQAMIPIACAVIHIFIRMDTTNLVEDDDIVDDLLSDEADVGESSEHATIQYDRDMHQFRDYVADCIHGG